MRRRLDPHGCHLTAMIKLRWRFIVPAAFWLGAPKDCIMLKLTLLASAALLAVPMLMATPVRAATADDIQTVVVIYAETPSFDNLYGPFPGPTGLANASPAAVTQVDRDGKPMRGLPAVW